MSLARKYYEKVTAQLRDVVEHGMADIDAAAGLVSDCLVAGRWIYVFGTGHSHMLAEELFYRAGGLARIRPILLPSLMLHVSAEQSTECERDVSLVDPLLDRYPVVREDVLVVVSNSGRNPVPVELARRAIARGATVVALVNRAHCLAFPSRHPDGLRLPDVASITIDNRGVVGDACVALPGTVGEAKIGAASTVTGAAILQMVACAAVEKALEAGWAPELFTSANADGGAENNRRLLEALRGEVEHL